MRDGSGKCNEVCPAKTFSGYCSLTAGCIKYPSFTYKPPEETIYSSANYEPPKTVSRIDKDSNYFYLYIGNKMVCMSEDFDKIIEELKKYGG